MSFGAFSAAFMHVPSTCTTDACKEHVASEQCQVRDRQWSIWHRGSPNTAQHVQAAVEACSSKFHRGLLIVEADHYLPPASPLTLAVEQAKQVITNEHWMHVPWEQRATSI